MWSPLFFSDQGEKDIYAVCAAFWVVFFTVPEMASLSFDSHPYWNQGLIICSNLKMHENAMEVARNPDGVWSAC